MTDNTSQPDLVFVQRATAMNTPTPPADVPPAAATPAQPGVPAIDVAALAEKVYQLMRRDLRLERERSGG